MKVLSLRISKERIKGSDVKAGDAFVLIGHESDPVMAGDVSTGSNSRECVNLRNGSHFLLFMDTDVRLVQYLCFDGVM